MNLNELLESLKVQVKKESTTQQHDTYLKRIIDFACRWHTNSAYPWRELSRQDTITTVDGTAEYYLVNDFNIFNNIWHQHYEKYEPINIISPNEFYESYVSSTDEGLPEVAVQVNQPKTLAQPSAATALSLVSSSSSDTNIQVRITGIVSEYPDSETVTLNGTTPVFTTKQFSRIDSVVKDDSTVGRITITGDATTIAVIPVLQKSFESNYNVVRFWPIPDDAYTIYYRYQKKQFRLVDNYDAPILSDDHDHAIISLAEFYVYRNESAWQIYKQIFRDLVSKEPVFVEDNRLITTFDRKFQNQFLSFGNNYDAF